MFRNTNPVWGTHSCCFYATKQDLLDLLVPYFKDGLEHNETCLWVLSDVLPIDEAKHALRKSVPNLDTYLESCCIEFLPYNEWYLDGGVFKMSRVVEGWRKKLDGALARGRTGLRVSGDTAWLGDNNWDDFLAYENALNRSISEQRMRALCTYPVDASQASDLLDVANAHQALVARRHGRWDLLRTAPVARPLEVIQSLVVANEDLKDEIAEHQRIEADLEQQKEILKKNITECERAEEALRESEERLRHLTEAIDALFWIKTRDFQKVFYLSPSYEQFTGRNRDARLREDGIQAFLAMIHPEDRPRMAEIIDRADGQGFEIEFRIMMPDGSLRWIKDRGFPIRDPSGNVYRIAGIAHNVTVQKLAEQQLIANSEQLRALSASFQSTREEERTRIAREIHDELGSALTILKWDLEAFGKKLCPLVDPSHVGGLQQDTTSMMNLIETIIEGVRRIASELRPSILDDLGLVEAIEWQAQQFQARTGIACHCGSIVENASLNKEQSTAVFRIFQETLTNVLRHAQATTVDISIHQDASAFYLTIADNGKGIADFEKSSPQSLGLLGMRERAHLVGGKVRIESIKPRGTVVIVEVPTCGALS